MRRKGICFALLASLLVGFCAQASAAERQAAAPDFQEVYRLVQGHLAGMEAPELNRIAVNSLVGALAPRVDLLDPEEKESAGRPAGPLVSETRLFEGGIAYARVSHVGAGLVDAVRQAYAGMETNRLTGFVLDLRFASGSAYDAAAETADLFLKSERPLLNWGRGVVRSKAKATAISIPVAVLVNHETKQAAEALAAAMRESGTALILGGRTAGQAMVTRDYPLQNGQRLRIAIEPVIAGEATPLDAEGVKPDLVVKVSLEDERAWLADPFKELASALAANSMMNGSALGTNRIVRRPRFNEADLVRERRDGPLPAMEDADSVPETPVVRDPALARALDLLKGLAVVRQSRS